MSKFRIRKLLYDGREQLREEFYRTIASLESVEEVRDFARDLFTSAEIVMFMRRIHVARLLIAGRTYKEIARILGAGTVTIKCVSARLARNGKGFEIIQKRLSWIIQEICDEISEEAERLENPNGFAALKRRYALYYGFETLISEAPKMIREAKAARGRKKTLRKAEER